MKNTSTEPGTPSTELSRVREWAQGKIQAGSEPPWAWYQYMKLIESIDTILEGMAVTTTENLQQSGQRPGTLLRLVEPILPQGNSLPRRVAPKVRMPM
jgi:hypothetical protein